MPSFKSVLSICLALGVYLASSGAGFGFELSVPVQCEIGVACFIQQYVDVAPGPRARDYQCGSATYDGHKGTDLRVSSLEAMRAGVAVLAAAPGRVLRVRDGMPDKLVRTSKERLAVRRRECGNGVVIGHGEGWETQYCHLRQGSIRVRRGERVARGTPLGLVGASGLAQFAHVHLTVRFKGRPVDPFTGLPPGSDCGRAARSARGLWTDAAARRLAYRSAVIIGKGFAGAPVEPEQLEQGLSQIAPAERAAGSLVLYARLINARAGDRIRLQVRGPGAFRVDATSAPLPRDKAHYVIFVGKKRRQTLWPSGHYHGEIAILRGENVLHRASVSITF